MTVHKNTLLYRWFRRDIGRKVIALALAVLLFVAIDGQVREDVFKTVRIQYVDYKEIDNWPKTGNNWTLLVAERAREPALVALRDQSPQNFSLQVKGSKAVVEELINTPRSFRFIPGQPGRVRITGSAIGLNELNEDLGASGVVSFVDELELEIAVEERRTLTLNGNHINTIGKPATGWVYPDDPSALRFVPPQIALIGPVQELDQAINGGEPLFQVGINGSADAYEAPLKLIPALAQKQIRVETEEPPDMQVQMVKDMVLFEETYVVPIQLIYDPNKMTQNQLQDVGGRQPRLEDAGESREIEILHPQLQPLDATDRELIRKNLHLVAFANEATTFTGPARIDIHIITTPSFPEEAEARFKDESDSQVRIIWEEPNE